MASSPVLVKDKLIVPMDNAGDSFLAAVDTKYGKNVWKVDRPRDINWTTPLVRTVGDTTEVLFSAPSGLTAYDAGTGAKRWTSTVARGSIPTGVLDGDMLYLPGGGVTAVKLGAKGPVGEPLMKSRAVQPGMPSPLVYLGKVYAANGSGIVSCADAKTGKEIFKERLKGAFSASPIAADGKVLLSERDRHLHRDRRDRERFRGAGVERPRRGNARYAGHRPWPHLHPHRQDAVRDWEIAVSDQLSTISQANRHCPSTVLRLANPARKGGGWCARGVAPTALAGGVRQRRRLTSPPPSSTRRAPGFTSVALSEVRANDFTTLPLFTTTTVM